MTLYRSLLLRRWVNRTVLSVLGSATCSVQDFVRTDLRTMFAIACGDRIDRTLHPSQVATRSDTGPFARTTPSGLVR